MFSPVLVILGALTGQSLFPLLPTLGEDLTILAFWQQRGKVKYIIVIIV